MCGTSDRSERKSGDTTVNKAPANNFMERSSLGHTIEPDANDRSRRPELLKNDALASEIASRQRFDWRVQADSPSNDPQMRRAVRELADSISKACSNISSSSANIFVLP
jgi:hypothetical protein